MDYYYNIDSILHWSFSVLFIYHDCTNPESRTSRSGRRKLPFIGRGEGQTSYMQKSIMQQLKKIISRLSATCKYYSTIRHAQSYMLHANTVPWAWYYKHVHHDIKTVFTVPGWLIRGSGSCDKSCQLICDKSSFDILHMTPRSQNRRNLLRNSHTSLTRTHHHTHHTL